MFPEITSSRVSFTDARSAQTLNNTVVALEACQRCPIAVKCLQFAIDNREPAGIWGGTFISERYEKAGMYPAAYYAIKYYKKLRAAVLEKNGSLICPEVPEPKKEFTPLNDYLPSPVQLS
jgi:hypothetical protein